jgi:hypothetical protein
MKAPDFRTKWPFVFRRHVVLYNRFEEHAAFDLRVEMLVASHQTTRLHDAKDHSINLHCSETSNVTHVSPVSFSKHLPM